jgi:hypothetical protein
MIKTNYNNIQIYNGSQFYLWRKFEYKEKTTNQLQVIDKLYKVALSEPILLSSTKLFTFFSNRGWSSDDPMIVGFTSTYAISVYHH